MSKKCRPQKNEQGKNPQNPKAQGQVIIKLVLTWIKDASRRQGRGHFEEASTEGHDQTKEVVHFLTRGKNPKTKNAGNGSCGKLVITGSPSALGSLTSSP